MSGKPAARQGDMTQYGGPIVQGSAGVRELARPPAWRALGVSGGLARNPVKTLLGERVWPGDTT
nr:hypothetical protein [Escherichia coli]